MTAVSRSTPIQRRIKATTTPARPISVTRRTNDTRNDLITSIAALRDTWATLPPAPAAELSRGPDEWAELVAHDMATRWDQ